MIIKTKSLLRAEPRPVLKEALRRFNDHGVIVRPPCEADVIDIEKALNAAIHDAWFRANDNGSSKTFGLRIVGDWMVKVDWDRRKAIKIDIWERFSV